MARYVVRFCLFGSLLAFATCIGPIRHSGEAVQGIAALAMAWTLEPLVMSIVEECEKKRNEPKEVEK